jgi:hypothetical protein
MDDWGLENEFPKLTRARTTLLLEDTAAAATTAATPTSATSRCFSKIGLQCLLFVARTYKCMYALQWTNIRGSLSTKVIRCLQILEDSRSASTADIDVGIDVDIDIESNRNGRMIQEEPAPHPLQEEPAPHPQQEQVTRTQMQTTATRPKSAPNRVAQPNPPPPKKTSYSDDLLPKSAYMELLPKSELMKLPVEQLCLGTGKVLRRFATAEAAQRSVTDSAHSWVF